MNDIDVLIQKIIAAAYKVHNQLGSGFLEKIYERALAIELSKQGIAFQTQHPIDVFYDDQKIGDYYADLFADNKLIVELKAVDSLSVAHEKQLINYLAATGIDDGLLLNFGSGSVQVKRKFRTYKKKDI